MTTPPVGSAQATAQRTFTDAPEGEIAQTSVGDLFKARLRGFWEDRRILAVAWGVALVAAAGAALVVPPVAPLAVAGLLLIAAVVVLLVMHHRASRDFWQGYATARGLRYDDDGRGFRADIPLLRKGDKRSVSRTLHGKIGGHDAVVAQYTWTDITRDSDGNRREVDHDYTLLHFTLPPAVAARFAGVRMRPKQLTFGRLQDGLGDDRSVELESADFSGRYTLRVLDEQDDIALYELMSTTFIDRLCTGPKQFWEQEGADLVCFRDGHLDESEDLDELCTGSLVVLERYLAEHR